MSIDEIHKNFDYYYNNQIIIRNIKFEQYQMLIDKFPII